MYIYDHPQDTREYHISISRCCLRLLKYLGTFPLAARDVM